MPRRTIVPWTFVSQRTFVPWRTFVLWRTFVPRRTFVPQRTSALNFNSFSRSLTIDFFFSEQNTNSNYALGHVILPCQVKNKRGMLQWTRDGFGLGVERNLTGFDRYHMSGYDEEGKMITHTVIVLNVYCLILIGILYASYG